MKERDHSEDLSVDGRILLKYIFMKYGGMLIGLIWLGTGTAGGEINIVMNFRGSIKCK
jgi:hypothetical protein